MPIFILVRQLVFLVCINSTLIMSPPARTINKTPLNDLSVNRSLDAKNLIPSIIFCHKFCFKTKESLTTLSKGSYPYSKNNLFDYTVKEKINK